VDSGLDENESELCVLVISVSLKVLADRDGLLDEVVKVLWKLGSEAMSLEDPKNLVTGDVLDLRNSVRISEDDTNLRRRGTFPGEFANLLCYLLRRDLEPGGRIARVRDGGGRNALAIAVKTTHFELLFVFLRIVEKGR
jgi:hypothetical protein